MLIVYVPAAGLGPPAAAVSLLGSLEVMPDTDHDAGLLSALALPWRASRRVLTSLQMFLR